MQPQSSAGDLLDRLCFFRGLYASRGVDDTEATLSVEAAVVYGEGLLRVARASEEQAASGTTQAAD